MIPEDLIKKIIFMLFFIFPLSLYAKTNIAIEELKSSKKVRFIDFQGDSKKSDKLDAVLKIGLLLSKGVAEKNEANYYNKYSIQHVVDEKSDLLSGDVFSLLPKAKVNTINYLRTILQAYIKEQYKYSESDSLALAVLVTYYNALYRTQPDYIYKKYSPKVTKLLKHALIGLATNYKDWPGKTQIIIPLLNNILGVSVNVFELGNKDILDELKSEGKKGIKERKAILGLQKKALAQLKEASKGGVSAEEKKRQGKMEQDIKDSMKDVDRDEYSGEMEDRHGIGNDYRHFAKFDKLKVKKDDKKPVKEGPEEYRDEKARIRAQLYGQ